MTADNPNQQRLQSIENLEREILTLATTINRATYELLLRVREFDERGGYLKWSMQNSAEWLAWRCDIGISAAREKVRVAHALKVLPAISASFASGELSYSKVRAMTRVANRQTEDELLTFALLHTAEHVEQRCRELRFGLDSSASVAERAYHHRSLRIRRDAERGIMTITVDVPIDSGELFEKALDKARDDQAQNIAELSWQAKQADAFVDLVRGYLAGGCEKDSSDNYLVTVHVDQSALAGGEGRSALPLESVKRLCCDGHAVVLTENDKGEPLSIGRKSRTIPTAIDRALRARDNNQCRFPGCCNRRFLDGHHVEHWATGGETSLDNLLLLCSHHHTLVHEGRYRILKDYSDEWFFATPSGVAIPKFGYRPEGTEDNEVADPSAEGFVVSPENRVSEPAPPAYLH